MYKCECCGRAATRMLEKTKNGRTVYALLCEEHAREMTSLLGWQASSKAVASGG